MTRTEGHRRLGLTARLIDDPDAAATYDRYHATVWPEVVADGRAAGATRTTIFRDGRRLFMVIDADDTFDLAGYAGSLSSPRTLEWQRVMDALLEDQPGASPGPKWRLVTEVCDVP
jgi:L-rhamnose mutarotase